MLTLLWNLGAATRSYLRLYMPTNRAVDWLRSPRGLKWAIPVALVATPVYLGATALAIEFAPRPGFGWLNILVFLSFGNSVKFAALALVTPLRWLSLQHHQRVDSAGDVEWSRDVVQTSA